MINQDSLNFSDSQPSYCYRLYSSTEESMLKLAPFATYVTISQGSHNVMAVPSTFSKLQCCTTVASGKFSLYCFDSAISAKQGFYHKA